MTWYQSVIDSFGASSLDTGIWSTPNGTTGVAVSGGELRLSSVSSYPAVVSTPTFDLTSGLLAVQFSSNGTAAAETEVYFDVQDNAGVEIGFGWDPETDYWYTDVENTITVTASTLPSAALVSGQWIAVGNYNASTKTLYLYTSSDGQTWTQIGSATISGTFNASKCGLLLTVGYYGSTSSNYIGQFDNASIWTQTPPAGGSGSGIQTYLGMYETNGAFPTPGPSAWPSGPTTNMSATYLAWGQDWTTYGASFIDKCNANSLIPFVELEPWNAGPNWNQTPTFDSITSGQYDSWLQQIGTFIASTGKDCWLTFAHEFNVSGQYPWSQGDSGSGPGGGALSAAQWIAGWKYVHDKINQTANGHAKWVWACSAYTGGTTISPAAYWPGASYVDIAAIDGYPSTRWDGPGQNPSLGTFAGQLQPTVTIIRNLGWTDPIFLSETNLHQMANGGVDTSVSPSVSFGPGQDITSFVADMAAANVNAALEFEDAGWNLPEMTSAEWTEYNSAVVTSFGNSGSVGSGTGDINVTVKTADQIQSVNGVANSTSSFSPTDGDMVWVTATWLDSVDALGKTFTCQDSQGTNYELVQPGGDADGGCYLLFFRHVYATAPGAITIKITSSDTTTAADCLIQPYVVEGAAADQSTAAHNSFSEVGTPATTYEISLNTSQNGSVVFIAAAPNNANHPVLIPVSGTQTDAEWDDDNVGSHGIIGRSSNATGDPGVATFGWTSAIQSPYGYGVMAYEVLPAVTSSGGGGTSGSPVQVRVGGAWVQSIPKVRVGGAWVTAVAKVRVNGAWVALSSASGGGPTYTQTLIDAFGGTSLNGTLWSNFGGSSSDVAVSGGLLKVHATTNYTSVAASGGTAYDITSGIFAAKFTSSARPTNTAAFAFFAVTDDTGTNAWAVQAYIGSDSWNGYNAGGTVVNITGDQTAFSTEWTDGDWLGWGMVGADSIMHLYKSSDGITWTEIGTVAMTGGLNKTTAYICLGAACDSGTTTYNAEFADASYFAVS